MNKATCRGCGAPIVWIKTPAGKAMPCDPAPVYYKAAPGGKDKIVTTRGEVVSCEIVPEVRPQTPDTGPTGPPARRPGNSREEAEPVNKIITNTGITAGDVCPKCLGSGKVKAMQMARYINGPTVLVEDTRVACDLCGGAEG